MGVLHQSSTVTTMDVEAVYKDRPFLMSSEFLNAHIEYKIKGRSRSGGYYWSWSTFSGKDPPTGANSLFKFR
jgi:hypothetical protein